MARGGGVLPQYVLVAYRQGQRVWSGGLLGGYSQGHGNRVSGNERDAGRVK